MLIVGLGNPGAKYKDTRHNIGFMAMDFLAEAHSIKLNKKDFDSLWGKGSVNDNEVILLKPQTYMNLSGGAVQGISGYFHIEPKDILVIYDDIDLEFGSVRVRPNGGSGGHRGMQSIIECLGTNDFPRIRLGIGRPEKQGQACLRRRRGRQGARGKGQEDVADYVLSNFTAAEKAILRQTLDDAKEAVDAILKDGIEKAMNRFNKK